MPANDLNPRLLYDVRSDDPQVLSGLDVFDVPGRHPSLPHLYKYTAGVHPQLSTVRDTEGKGVIYVYLVDSSPEASARARARALEMDTPTGLTNAPGGNPGMLFLCVHAYITHIYS